MMLAYKVLQFWQNFALRLKKKLHVLPLLHMHPLRQNASKRSHHFVTK